MGVLFATRMSSPSDLALHCTEIAKEFHYELAFRYSIRVSLIILNDCVNSDQRGEHSIQTLTLFFWMAQQVEQLCSILVASLIRDGEQN